MFTLAVNAPCINRPFSDSTIGAMARADEPHPSLVRLLAVAREATVHKRKPVDDWAGLAAAMKVSAQVMTNWKSRGISVDAAIKAEQLFGCSGSWLLTGKTPPALPAGATVVVARESPPAWPAHHAVSPSEWALLQDIKVLPEEERTALTHDVQARASKFRAYAKELLARHGANGDAVSDEEVRAHLPPPPGRR